LTLKKDNEETRKEVEEMEGKFDKSIKEIEDMKFQLQNLIR
jgi:hypothetical protein